MVAQRTPNPAHETSDFGDAAVPAEPPYQWWERRTMVALAVALTAVPLLYPAIPPLVDLLGHMGRFRVELDLGQSPWLQRYFAYHWAAIGNLGVDLLMMALGPLIGLEPAVKLIMLTIPMMTVAGFLWVAREVHGRVPPTAYFAVPFAFGHPFLFGFVNFALAMALAFLAFGLWLRLARFGRFRLRALLFVPISVVLYFTHTFGWGVLGLLCFSAEAVRQHDRGAGWLRAALNAALHSAVMALPIIIMVAWRSGAGGGTTDWFNWKMKLVWLKSALRDRWQLFDVLSTAAMLLVGIEALRNPRLTFSRNLAFTGLVLVTAFILLPRIVFGSAYADMRLVPYFIAVLLLAIRFRGPTHRSLGTVLAVLAMIFVVVRLGSNTLSLGMAANDQTAKLKALDHVPMGARVASFYGLGCGVTWPLWRNSHLGALVIVRKDGFSNDQWVMPGLNLLEIKYREPGSYAMDPSEVVRPRACPDRLHHSIDYSLANLPRDAFDFVWLIDAPAYDPTLVRDMTRVWAGPGSELYRINRGGAGLPPATPRTASAPGRSAPAPPRTRFAAPH